MKAKEVLDILKITRPTLTKYVREGVITTEQQPNGRYEYQEDSVYSLLEQKQTGKGDKNYRWYTLPEYPYYFSTEEKQMTETRDFWNRMRKLIDSVGSCCLSGMFIDGKIHYFVGIPSIFSKDNIPFWGSQEVRLCEYLPKKNLHCFYQDNIEKFKLSSLSGKVVQSQNFNYIYYNALMAPKGTQIVLEFERGETIGLLKTDLYVTLKVVTDKTLEEIKGYLNMPLRTSRSACRKSVSPDIYESFVPFEMPSFIDSKHGMDYGIHIETKEPIKINRKYSDIYKTMMVCGINGTGKQCGTEKEIQQILDKYTDDKVIISNTEYEHSKENWKAFYPENFERIEMTPIIENTRGIFLDGEYQINVLDIVYDAKTGVDLIKKCKQAVVFIEAFYTKKNEQPSLNDNDVSAVYQCVLSLLIPFAEKLKMQCNGKACAYDPIHNPKHADLMNALLESNCSLGLKEMILSLKHTFENSETQENSDKHSVFIHNALHHILWDTKGTNLPDEKCLELGIHNAWISGSYYPYLLPALTASYVDTMADIGKYQSQTIWIYWDFAHLIFRSERLTEVIFETINAHVNIRATFEFLSIDDFCTDLQLEELFKKSNMLWKFYSLCPLDRTLLPQVMQIPEWVVEGYLREEPAGMGVFVYNDACIPFNERDET